MKKLPPKPSCFESQEQWESWLDAARIHGEPVKRFTHCQDCTLHYQTEMIRDRRCENPGHIFLPEKDAA